MNGIGANIKNIRELRNYTQEFMAQKLKMTQAGYSKIECGESDVPFSKLKEIAKVLAVKVEDLISFDQQKIFNGFNNVKGNNSNNLIVNDIKEIKKLYEDKVSLLEKLLKNSEGQLARYQDKFGDI